MPTSRAGRGAPHAVKDYLGENKWIEPPALSGYEVLPDGRKDPFVGVFKRDGKQIIVSTELGAATADVAGDEIERCWQDNLSTVSVAVCDVMKKAQ